MQTIRLKQLHTMLPKHSGRDRHGHVSVRHQGGRHKRFYRSIDWHRSKDGIPARVVMLEYDPNRSAHLALVQYKGDGERRYILAPEGLQEGATVLSGRGIDAKVGNSLPLGDIPLGVMVHAVEIVPGKGAQMMRSAGSGAVVLAKDTNSVQLKLPSGEVRVFDASCRATVGQVGNIDWKNQVMRKAGRMRHRGKRPQVRGVAQNPRSHPHGGGEGRSGIGMSSPKSPWGKRTLGKKTRKARKYSDAFIIQRRP